MICKKTKCDDSLTKKIQEIQCMNGRRNPYFKGGSVVQQFMSLPRMWKVTDQVPAGALVEIKSVVHFHNSEFYQCRGID